MRLEIINPWARCCSQLCEASLRMINHVSFEVHTPTCSSLRLLMHGMLLWAVGVLFVSEPTVLLLASNGPSTVVSSDHQGAVMDRRASPLLKQCVSHKRSRVVLPSRPFDIELRHVMEVRKQEQQGQE